jgi:hypothetical protein
MSRRRRFVLTPEARADLIEIWRYIAEDASTLRTRHWPGCMMRLRAWGGRRGWPPPRRPRRLATPLLDGLLLCHRLSLGNDTDTDRRNRVRSASAGSILPAADSIAAIPVWLT